MKVIDRYIGAAAAIGAVLALFTLVALDGILAFVQEIPDIGTGQYGVVQAATYIFLTLPRRAFDFYPTAALLGALLGVGALAVNSELVALRASGVSRQRIGAAALAGCMALAAPMMAIGEWIAPAAEETAQELRVTRQGENLSLGGPTGVWVRSGNSIINAERLLETGALSGVTVLELGPQRRLAAATRAVLARPIEEGWELTGVRRTELGPDGANAVRDKEQIWPELVDPELLRVAALKPEDLSLRALDRYIEYLNDNELDAYRYEQAFWYRAIYPLTVIALVIAGLPFIFGPLRQGGFGQRVFMGIAIGLAFFLVNRTLVRFGEVYDLDPLAVTLLPPLLVALVATIYLRRTFA